MTTPRLQQLRVLELEELHEINSPRAKPRLTADQERGYLSSVA